MVQDHTNFQNQVWNQALGMGPHALQESGDGQYARSSVPNGQEWDADRVHRERQILLEEKRVQREETRQSRPFEASAQLSTYKP